MTVLREQLEQADAFASIDLADLMDLQQTRPTARWEEDGVRVIDWPMITIEVGRLGRDVILVSGPEPSLRWPEIAQEIADMARDLGVRDAYTLAGMPALVSHRRAVPVFASA